MRRNIFKTKNKRGQVFLLLAIVILIYLILLSTTVYEITQSPYIDPAPNQEQLMNYIDNSISSFTGLAEVALSQYSQGVSENDIILLIQSGISDVEAYLDAHNLPAIVEFDDDNIVINNSSISINPVFIRFAGNFSIFIDSPDIYYEALFSLDIAYYLEISEIAGTDNSIYLYKISNNVKTLINNGEINITPSTTISNLGDGSYQADLQLGQTIAVTFDDSIYLWMEVIS